jgi:hypothetical protein
MTKTFPLMAALALVALAAQSNMVTTAPISVPQMLSYQGRLTNAAGDPVPDSTYSVVFGLYPDAVGGSPFWTETQSVQTQAGLFGILLGSVTPIGALPEDGRCYLQMQVEPNPPMAPRIKIASAAYAYLARKADTANYAAISRPIAPPVAGTEIALPCTLHAAVPLGMNDGVLRIQNDSTGSGLTIESQNGVGVYVRNSGSVGYYVRNAAERGFQVDSAGAYGLVIYRAQTGDAIFTDTSASHAFYAGTCSRGFGVSHALDVGVVAYADTIGGWFIANTSAGVGVQAHAYGNNTTDTAIQAYGRGYATGGWYTGGLKGESEAPCLVSPELGIVAAGSATLDGDAVTVQFPRVLTSNVRSDIPVRITVTPRGEPAGVLYVSGTDATGFRVSLKRVPGWNSDAGVAFDWIAFGSLKEHETSPEAKAAWGESIRERDRELQMRRARLAR